MKTPKREYKKDYIDSATGELDEWTVGNIDARWHRKNRIRALKHTIAVLTRKLRDTERCLAHTHLSPQKVLVIPDHWCGQYTQILKELNKP